MDHERTTDHEERVASLFQPDTLLSDQYIANNKSKQLDPGKRLMLAVVQDAIVCFQDYVLAQDVRKKALFREAEAWIMAEGKDWIFSFDNVCESLGLHPGYLRSGLLRWKRKRLSNERKPVLGKRRPSL